MYKLKYACIGAGGIANKKHLNEYSKLENVEILAICDTNIKAAEALAEKYSIPNIFHSYEDMFKSIPLDLISVCAPNYLHTPITVAALNHGINVHCEKPLSLSSTEVQRIIEAKNQSNKKVMVALNNRFTAESQFVKNYADQGGFGEIYRIKCGWIRRNGIPGRGSWFTNKKLSGGGSLIDLGVHYLDLAMYFMNYPKVSTVMGSTFSKFGDSRNRIRPGYKSNDNGIFDVEDMANGFIKLGNGATIDFEFSWASNIEKECKYYEILGTKGGARWVNDKLEIFTEVNDSHLNLIPDTNSFKNSVNEFSGFVDCIINDVEPSATAEEAFTLMQIIDSIYAGEKDAGVFDHSAYTIMK